MKILLFGSSDTTRLVADYLYEHQYNLTTIVTNTESFKISYRPSGVKNSRYQNMKNWAQDKDVDILLYEDTNQLYNDLNHGGYDFAIVAGWYHMIPKRIRALFPQGCAGFHASLLPKLRGGAPLNWALLLGHKETGVSCFELSDGVDDGPLYGQKKFLIDNGDNINDLIQKSNKAITNLLGDILPKLQNNRLEKYPQHGEPSYCGQRGPEDSKIDWQNSSNDILRLIRASTRPYPGAYSYIGDQKITIWSALAAEWNIHANPGQILIVDDSIYVGCRQGAIKLHSVDEPEHNLPLLVSKSHCRYT